MAIKNIKTAADLLKEREDAIKEAEKQAAIAEKTKPETLAGLVDRIEKLEADVAKLQAAK